MSTTDPPHTRPLTAWRPISWWGLGAVVFISASIGWRVERAWLDRAKRNVETLAHACQPLVAAEARIAQIRARAADISRREVAIEQLLPTRQPTRLLSVIGRAAADQVVVEELDLLLEGRGLVRLTALGGQDAAIERFFDNLRAQAEFAAIECTTVNRPRTASAIREFEIGGPLN